MADDKTEPIRIEKKIFTRLLRLSWQYRSGCIKAILLQILLLAFTIFGLSLIGVGIDYIRHLVDAKSKIPVWPFGFKPPEDWDTIKVLCVIAAANIAPRRSVGVSATRGLAPNVLRPGETSIYRNPKSVVPATRPTVEPAATTPAPAPARKEPEKPKQETLPLAEVSRGRFDKSEPTLYDGEDLDVPTFLRRGISLKK